MRHTTSRTVLPVLVLLLAGLLGGFLVLHDQPVDPAGSREAAGSPPRPPTVTYTDTPAPAQRELVEWASDRFALAGLALPDFTVSFPADCGGKAGRYLVGAAHLELCHPTRKLVVHELAHLWDDHADVDRAALSAALDADHWYEKSGHTAHESAGERLAHVITWGLLPVDTMSREMAFPGQPAAEQPRHLHGVPHLSPTEVATVFTQATGVAPLAPLPPGAGS